MNEWSSMETIQNSDGELQFCPICQVPLKLLKIISFVHISMCDVRWEDLSDCEDGTECCSENRFHYRDFSHKVLANHRENLRKRKLEELSNKGDTNIIAESKSNVKKVLRRQQVEEDEDDDIFVSTNSRTATQRSQRSRSKIETNTSAKKKMKNSIRKCTSRKPEKEDDKFDTSCSSSNHEASIVARDQTSFEGQLSNNEGDTIIDELPAYDYSLDDENLTVNSESDESHMENLTEQIVKDIIEKKEKCKVQWNNLFKGRFNTSKSTAGATPSKTNNKKRRSMFGNAKEIKPCPSFKKMPGTSFAVDAFQFGNIPGITAYFLTHFHSDHYIGLRKSFSNPIYCSSITANLVKKKLRVSEKYLHVLEIDSPIVINCVEVTCFDANHCPGAVIILFRLMNGEQFLHVGDFRACVEMESIPQLRNNHIDRLYLDTTYFNPAYVFPTQKEVVERVKSIVRSKSAKHQKALFISGTYSIGKEKVFIGMLEELQCKLWAQPQKVDIFRCINDPVILSAMTSVPEAAKVHVLPMNHLMFDRLRKYMLDLKGAFTHIFAFKPTGWEMGRRSGSGDWLNVSTEANITIYGVPYSEHSNYEELCRFVNFIKADKVIPTVTMKNRQMYGILKSLVDSYKSGPKQQSIQQYFSSSQAAVPADT